MPLVWSKNKNPQGNQKVTYRQSLIGHKYLLTSGILFLTSELRELCVSPPFLQGHARTRSKRCTATRHRGPRPPIETRTRKQNSFTRRFRACIANALYYTTS